MGGCVGVAGVDNSLEGGLRGKPFTPRIGGEGYLHGLLGRSMGQQMIPDGRIS